MRLWHSMGWGWPATSGSASPAGFAPAFPDMCGKKVGNDLQHHREPPRQNCKLCLHQWLLYQCTVVSTLETAAVEWRDEFHSYFPMLRVELSYTNMEAGQKDTWHNTLSRSLGIALLQDFPFNWISTVFSPKRWRPHNLNWTELNTYNGPSFKIPPLDYNAHHASKPHWIH